jgi:DNA-binding beta-propeller fold protein YncE
LTTDGSTAYVTDAVGGALLSVRLSDGTISSSSLHAVDLSTGVVTVLSVGFPTGFQAQHIVLGVAGHRVYGAGSSNSVTGVIFAVDLEELTLDTVASGVDVPTSVSGLALRHHETPATTTLYYVNQHNSSITAIHYHAQYPTLTLSRVVSSIDFIGTGVAFNPDKTVLYVVDASQAGLYKLNLDSRVLKPVTLTGAPLPSPASIAVSADGTKAYLMADDSSGRMFVLMLRSL